MAWSSKQPTLTPDGAVLCPGHKEQAIKMISKTATNPNREFYKCAREPEAQCKMFSMRALASSRDHSTWPYESSTELISLLPPPAAWADEIRGHPAYGTWHKLGTSNSALSAELRAPSQTQPESSQRQEAVNESQTQVEFPGIPSTPARNRRRQIAGLPTPSRTNDGRQPVASSSSRAAEIVGTFASGAPPAARLPQSLPSPPRSSAAPKQCVREPSPDWPSDDDVDWDAADLEVYAGVAASSPSAPPRRAPTAKARTTTTVKRELVSDEDEIGEFASSMVDGEEQKPFSFGRRIHAVKQERKDEDDQGAVLRRGTSGYQARSKKAKVDDANPFIALSPPDPTSDSTPNEHKYAAKRVEAQRVRIGCLEAKIRELEQAAEEHARAQAAWEREKATLKRKLAIAGSRAAL